MGWLHLHMLCGRLTRSHLPVGPFGWDLRPWRVTWLADMLRAILANYHPELNHSIEEVERALMHRVAEALNRDFIERVGGY